MEKILISKKIVLDAIDQLKMAQSGMYVRSTQYIIDELEKEVKEAEIKTESQPAVHTPLLP